MIKSFFKLTVFFLLLTTSCYKLEKNLNETIRIDTFKNNTTIYGLQLKLANILPETFRTQTTLQTTESFHGKYLISGEVLEYKKIIIRRDSKGEPTQQQSLIKVKWNIKVGENQIAEFTSSNEDHNLNSGIYNITKSESENNAINNALNDLASIIAEKAEIAIRFKEVN